MKIPGLAAISYDMRAVAEALGLTPQWAAELAKTGRLPAYRIGPRGNWRMLATDLEKYVLQRRAMAARVATYPRRDAAWWQAYRDHHSDE